ncbi:MAG TPA: hypothetical protein VFB67_04890, partial [Candidatus Polarisedimenticolaceae bacterium]|nr:hypothetical protein [Candidatus Polarisedimenticolaceae bacterium]
VDVAVLDMNHGWPNVGHDAVVATMREAARALSDALAESRIRIRALSFDVRRALQVPAADDTRYGLYVGTGGPGHLDPRRNDGRDAGAQGVTEDPAWEAPLFRLFDAVAGREDAALLGVCHTFGLMCRWLDVARPAPRGPEKGGKSEGVRENLLTEAAREHPLFAAFAATLPPGGRLRVLDSRIYDLIPNETAARRVRVVGVETLGVGGPPGEAMTMMEVARDAGGTIPRVFAVNHHPEIVDRTRLMTMLEAKLGRGEIDPEWFAYRKRTLDEHFPDAESDGDLRVTSAFTFAGPLRFHLTRLARMRAEELGSAFRHEEGDVARRLLGGNFRG